MDWNKLADVLVPDENVKPLDYYEALYPERDLPKGAQVTRLAPSPTGFIHLGNLFVAIANERIAHQSGGLMYLRIEDTDLKRKVDGAVDAVKNALRYFDIRFDEGAEIEGAENAYGPYYQRERAEIYHAYAKELIRQGLAYPCFCTEDELSALREKQTAEKKITGYYGEYAACRNLSEEEIYANLAAGKPYVIRLRSQGNAENKLTFRDEIKGDITVTENDQDVVILKSDGIPTYHFAHAIDDHFMRTTLVIRGEEWLASLPIHIELFNVLGFRRPKYGHNCSLQKIDGDTRRKLSKRKDPELALSYYQQEGISPDAIWEFLLTLLNSNFEEWRIANPEKSYLEFPYTLEKMNISGALVDLNKLRDISKDVIGAMPAQKIFDSWLDWCKQYNEQFASLIEQYPERTLAALNVGRTAKKPRKDLETWKQACDFMSFYYDETFKVFDEMPQECDEETVKTFFTKYLASYNHEDDSNAWFEKVRAITEEMGFALRPKDYKNNPEQYKGSIVHTTNMLRIALTGHANAPDIWEVSHVLGEDIVRGRIVKYC